MKVTKVPFEPAPPPLEKVVLELSPEEAKMLWGIVYLQRNSYAPGTAYNHFVNEILSALVGCK